MSSSTDPLKILADENISAVLVDFLISKGIDIKYASKGIKNSALFSLARRENRVLLTHDSDFLNTVLYTLNSSPGIIVLAVHPPELSKLESAMTNVLKQFSGVVKGKLLIVKETGVEILSE